MVYKLTLFSVLSFLVDELYFIVIHLEHAVDAMYLLRSDLIEYAICDPQKAYTAILEFVELYS